MGSTLKTTMTPTVKLGRTAGGGVTAAKTTLGRMQPSAAASAGTSTPYIGTMPPLHGSCHKGSSKEVKKLIAMGEGGCRTRLCAMRWCLLLVFGSLHRQMRVRCARSVLLPCGRASTKTPVCCLRGFVTRAPTTDTRERCVEA